MAYDFSDQQAKLDSLIGDDVEDTDAMFPTAVRKEELNRGEVNFAVDSKCILEKATGSVSSGAITLPSDWIDTHILIINNKVVTKDNEIPLSDYELWYQWSGSPVKFYYWEISGTRQYNILPSSDTSAYILFYFKKPTTALSADTDESLLPDEFREGPVYYAASELLTQIGKVSLADYYRNKYEYWVNRARDYAQKLYIQKERPLPDLGDGTLSQTDVQGRGRKTGFVY